MLSQLIRLVSCLLVVMALVAAGLLGIVRLSGHRILAVQTGSMQPVFRPGDAVLVSSKPAAVYPGQIVSYHSLADPAVIVTHRVVRIDDRSGWLITKGDRLTDNDPAFPPRLLVGRANAVLPKYGLVTKLLRRPIALVFAIYLPAFYFAYQELGRLLDALSKPHYRLPGYQAHK